jgi:hypothetical protein
VDMRSCVRLRKVITAARGQPHCQFNSHIREYRKATDKLNTFKGDGGRLRFTDKYWGSAVIPDRTAGEARFQLANRTAGGLQASSWEGANCRARSFAQRRPASSQAESQHDRQLQSRHRSFL